MAKTIIIAGYTKYNYLQKIRSYFLSEDVTLVCTYHRQPITEAKQTYLQAFDLTLDLNKSNDIARLQELSDTIDCVTCIQERDMMSYIATLKHTARITPEVADSYTALIDKHHFKTKLSSVHPELVPKSIVVDESTLTALDTLSYPQVIKPSGLCGSIMVAVVDSPEAFSAQYYASHQDIRSIASTHYHKEVQIISEEYISGPQYSVNAYIDTSGTPTLCPLVRVVPPQERGGDDTYNLMQYTTNEVSDDDRMLLLEAIQKIITCFTITDTSVHFDAVLHDGQWKFFEVGLRIGGNRQKLFQYSHGLDHLCNDIRNRLGLPVILPPQIKTVCILQKASDTTGTLQTISYNRFIDTTTTPKIIEDKIAKLHSHVQPVSQGGGTIVRYFVIGEDEAHVVQASDQLYESVKLTVQPE